MKKVVAYLLALLMVLSLAACGGQGTNSSSAETEAPKQSYNYTWSACSSSSGYYALNVAVSDVINKYVDNVNVTVMESGGGAANLKNIFNGDAQFGQTSVPDIYLASKALGSFEGTEPNTEIRILLSLIPNIYYFVVSEESGINSISDLQGKSFSPGNTNSSTERLAYAVLSVLGIEPDWYYASTSEAVSAMKDRRITGFMKSGSSISLDSSIADVQTSMKIKVLSFTEEEVKKIQEAYPFYSFDYVDASIFGQEGKVLAMSSYYSFAVDKDVPEDVAYNIVKALVENKDYLASAYSAVGSFDPVEITATSTSGYMHAGLIKYLKEKGYTIKDDQIPPEAK